MGKIMLPRRSGNRGGRATADVARLRARGWALLIALLLLIVPASPRVAASASARARILSWVRTDPLRPRVLYAGGYGALTAAPMYNGRTGCGQRAARSADGGATWRPLPFFAGFPSDSGVQLYGCAPLAPFLLSPEGMDLFVTEVGNGSSIRQQGLLHSADAGLHWTDPFQPLVPAGAITYDERAPSFSPVDPRRAYADVRQGEPGLEDVVGRSDDGGSHWRAVATALTPVDATVLSSVGSVDETLPDPVARDTVYLGVGDPDPTPPIRWLRSDDGGRTWHRLRLPASPSPDPGPVTNVRFADYPGLPLSVDTHLPGAIVLRGTNVAGVPADRRWVSRDRGTTWKQTVCPGDLRGTCPTYTLDNVFGAGKAYGFYADGVHAFAGAGLAGPRLALSDRLPCRGADVLDAGGGAHMGDPAYLLCQASKGQRTKLSATLPVTSDTSRVGTLYRSTDAGASWRKLDPTAGW